jgi:surface carbohydrate biosynthesis protein
MRLLSIKKMASLGVRMFSKTFTWLPQSERHPVLVIDTVSVDIVTPLLPKEATFLTLPIREPVLFVNFSILLTILSNLILVLRHQLSFRGVYSLAVTKSIQAKLIISIIDNNDWGNLFRFSDVRVLSIQNGLRSPLEFSSMSEQDIYLGFPRIQPNALKAREYIGAGSLKACQAGLKDQLCSPSNGSVVTFISQYRPHAGWFDEMVRSQVTLAKWSYKFARNHQLDFKIALNGRNSTWLAAERALFESAKLGLPNFSSFEKDSLGNYRALEDSTLVVGHSSTLLIESLAVGKRPIICYRKGYPQIESELDPVFQDVDSAFLLPADATFDVFSLHASSLLSMNETTFHRLIKKARNEICTFDTRQPVFETMQSKIAEFAQINRS